MCIVCSASVGGQQRERERGKRGERGKERIQSIVVRIQILSRAAIPQRTGNNAQHEQKARQRPTDRRNWKNVHVSQSHRRWLWIVPFPPPSFPNSNSAAPTQDTHTYIHTHTPLSRERTRDGLQQTHKGPTASTTGDPDHNDKETLTDTEFLILGCLLLLFLQLLACFAVFSFTSLFALASFRLFRLLAHFLHFFVFDSWKKHERYNTTDRRCGLVLFVSDG